MKNDLIIAKNDILFKKMKFIGDKFWELDVFKREVGETFFENNNNLEIIGNEIFNDFNIKNPNYFLDVCSAPGIYSKIFLENFDKSVGYGISLPVEEGGVPFIINNNRFNIIYKNILDKDFNLLLDHKLDLGIASCVSYKYDAKSAYLLNINLILKSLTIIFRNLKKNGNIIINLTMKNIDLAFNIINILNTMFKKFKLWKSKTIWATKKTFYYFGYNFKKNYKENILEDLIERIKYDNDSINNQFLGSNHNYLKIYNQMKHIYNIKINAWNKLINENK
jgi:23S rRNA U2552 (ribose-2'-O)-methylase RlmE/FtsJ